MGGSRKRHIVVIGEMGVGKTTVGKLLAAELGLAFLDSDAWIEQKKGQTGREIAAREGVPRLHEIELAAFLEMAKSTQRSVIAPAASVVEDDSAREALSENFTIWLTAPDAVVAERAASDEHRRPIDAAERADLRSRRRPFLEAVNAISLDSGSDTPEETVSRIIERLSQARASSRAG